MDFKYKDNKDTRIEPPHAISDNALLVEGKAVPYKNNGPYGHDELLDNNIRTINFVDLAMNDPWDELRLPLVVKLDPEYDINDLSEHVHNNKEIQLVAELICNQSKYINKKTIDFIPEGSSFDLVINRTDVYIKVELKIYAVINKDYNYDGGSSAVKKGSVVATAPGFNFQIDPIDPHWGGGIREDWKEFSGSEKAALFRIEFENDENTGSLMPIIWWNKNNKKTKQLLEIHSAGGEENLALRDLVVDLCGVIIMLQLSSGIDWGNYPGEEGDQIDQKVFTALKSLTGISNPNTLVEEIKQLRNLEANQIVPRLMHKLGTGSKLEKIISLQNEEG
jgi:hypothetical protein